MSDDLLQTPPVTAEKLIDVFDRLFLQAENTRLRGGAEEPFYAPSTAGEPATVWFRADYVRSALHEVAHWCLAGVARRQLPDYGYWYTPDDRNASQQSAFFSVEARPQAIERSFCEPLGLPFRPSVDNLALVIDTDALQAFESRLDAAYETYIRAGLPARAALFRDALVGRANIGDDLCRHRQTR